MTLLEVCCYSMECALEAQRRGADRIELCAAPQEGGLTPSLGVLKSVREAVTIPVHPIIRPRGGDFCYTAGEFAAMLDDVAAVKDLGFPGMVIGVLDADGRVDRARMKKIMAAAGTLAVTFHISLHRSQFTISPARLSLNFARFYLNKRFHAQFFAFRQTPRTSGAALSAVPGVIRIRHLYRQ